MGAILNLIVFHMLFTYMWPQVVLLNQPFHQTLVNSLLCMLGFLPHALAGLAASDRLLGDRNPHHAPGGWC